MKYVVIRDDDTNALTPPEYIERLYRPFLEKGMPVNLATIPNVRTDVTYGDGIPEGFLVAKNGESRPLVRISEGRRLLEYLRANRGFKMVQHGCHHEFVGGNTEFDHFDQADIARRLDEGLAHFAEAGFARPTAFVAPYDRLTPVSLAEVRRRFAVLSTGWFEWRRLPPSWWPRYLAKKVRRQPHWRIGKTALLTHPGCLLSYHRPYGEILPAIQRSIDSRRLTVLVTHWWEFFRGNRPDDKFIDVLHETAEYIGKRKDVQVVAFDDVASGQVPLN